MGGWVPCGRSMSLEARKLPPPPHPTLSLSLSLSLFLASHRGHTFGMDDCYHSVEYNISSDNLIKYVIFVLICVSKYKSHFS
jgi:hypothetical protein